MKEKRIPCPFCSEPIIQNANKCPFCQTDLKNKTKKSAIGKAILIILGSLGLIFIACVIYVIYIMNNVDNKFTGQELFDAVNEHRKSVGAQELQLDENLCDNLVERWLAIREPGNGHKGFEEWAETEGLVEGGLAKNYKLLGELYANGTQTYWLIDFWVGSPGHRTTLENPKLNVGCAYASDGTGVVIVAEK